jgi:hypothetical protein
VLFGNVASTDISQSRQTRGETGQPREPSPASRTAGGEVAQNLVVKLRRGGCHRSKSLILQRLAGLKTAI